MKKIILISCFILIFTSCGGVNVGNTPVIDIITASSPADGAIGVDVTQSITVFFGAEVDPTTINSTNIFLTRAGGTVWVPGTLTYDNEAMSITFTPLFPMIAGANYLFTITNGVLTKALGADAYNLAFTTKKSPILFVTNEDPANPALITGYNVWSYDPDTGARTNLTAYPVGTTAFDPVWSPDYTKISYIYGPSRDPNLQPTDGQYVDVFVMNADGTGQTNLTGLSGDAKALNPTWYPDGSKVYFQLRPDGETFFNINFVDQTGGALTNLTSRPLGETTASSDIGYYFTFSPEGTGVLYPVKNDTTGTVDLHLIGAEGSGDSAITNVGTGEQAKAGSFSADGTKVYFSATPFSNIYSVLTDGTGLANISGGTADQWYEMIALFPDGTKILYLFGHDPSGGFPIYDLYVMNADGTSRLALTSASATDMASKAFLSPDGGLVAYGFGDPDSLIDLYLTGSDGSANTRITSLLIMQSLVNALWSPDGDKLVYSYGDILSIGFGSGKIVLIGNDGSSPVDIAGSATSDAWLGDWW